MASSGQARRRSIRSRSTMRRPAATIAVLCLGFTGCSITGEATNVTETGATLTGSVHPVDQATDWWFEHGETERYGRETQRRTVPAGGELVPVSERIGGLQPETDYHFRLCSQRPDEDRHCGDDRSFRTVSDELPPGFEEQVAFTSLVNPTAVRFAPDGRVFVAERHGAIKVFDDMDDTTPATFADLRKEVHAFWDRGLLGLALDPEFPARPFVYVAYTHDAPIGGTAPRWGTVGGASDGCPNPPGATGDGCVVSGRISRLKADGNSMKGPEQVLVEDWCQQYPSHSVGSLAFGPDGSLYASGGDGASFNTVDYGQFGSPRNPCGDPPGEPGDALTPPAAEGGALRSQDLRSPGDPAGLSGTVIRIDPETGEGMAGNPGASSTDRNVRRIVAQGLRNPFRITTRPGTDEVWLGDVGWNDFEEINRLPNPKDSSVDNFGWPCFEGPGRQPGYDGAGLALCEGFYTAGGHAQPFLSYRHSDPIVAGEECGTGSSSTSGVAFGFYDGGPYPAEYDGALFFADFARNCIWVLKRSGGTLPSPGARSTFLEHASNPVDLQVSPAGELFYVDFHSHSVRRIVYTAGNRPPKAVATADKTHGALPLTVRFDGSSSDDPDSASPLTYAWDLDGDGQHDDSTSAQPTFTYSTAGTYTAELRVTDIGGASATDAVTINAGNTPPTATIAEPSPGVTWEVGEEVTFSGAGADDQDGDLPASALSWTLTLQHCPSNCHSHAVQSWQGDAADSFDAPNHEYPSHLELRLTARDAGGLTDSQTVRLDPRIVAVSLESTPSGLTLTLGSSSATAPFTRTLIDGAATSIAAPSPQTQGGNPFVWRSWSDGGARAHDVTVNDDATFRATFGPP